MINLIGQKFNRLTILDITGRNKEGHLLCRCLCECGKEKIIRAYRVQHGYTKSCGCLNKETSKRILTGNSYCRLEPGKSGFNLLVQKYKYTAKRKNINFNLTKEECEKLFKGNCYYCGIEPQQISLKRSKGMTKKGIEHSKFLYNGIDRVNNNLDYSIDNVVSCCKVCNYSKSDYFSKDEFKYLMTYKLAKSNGEDPWKDFRN